MEEITKCIDYVAKYKESRSRDRDGKESDLSCTDFSRTSEDRILRRVGVPVHHF